MKELSSCAERVRKRMTSMSIEHRMAAGKGLRDHTSRKSHADWVVSSERRDPVAVIEGSNQGRLAHLTPIRHGRMLRNPFAFLRGSAALMANDLAETPATGIAVQACGDCHLSNFGLFATPERNLIFDLNDFDETLPAPWEWDVKRLVASFVVASRVNGFSEERSKEIAMAGAGSYRQHLREYSLLSPLEIWYARIDADVLIEGAESSKSRRIREKMAIKARSRVGEQIFPKITELVGDEHRFVEEPPITQRIVDTMDEELVRKGLESYRESLPEDRRLLLDRYRIEDMALRVVGVGSVGTRCFVMLYFCDDQNSLLLQLKEATRSVLEPFTSKSEYDNQGKRVVVGQRIIQAASDLFLGWCRVAGGHDFYIRQLRDMKYSVPVEELSANNMQRYAEICGWALARAHARSGLAATITGYLGKSEQFERALGDFAVAYADQTEQDHAAFAKAAALGRIAADLETD